MGRNFITGNVLNIYKKSRGEVRRCKFPNILYRNITESGLEYRFHVYVKSMCFINNPKHI
jgi:hypothetical protein